MRSRLILLNRSPDTLSVWNRFGFVMKCLFVILILVMPFSGNASILLVPSEYPTINDAISASESNDTIMVGPGTYPEYIYSSGIRPLYFISEFGPDSTILTGSGGMAISIITRTAHQFYFEGFEIADCGDMGVSIEGSGNFGSFTNCRFRNNAIALMAAGDVDLIDCQFIENDTAIYCPNEEELQYFDSLYFENNQYSAVGFFNISNSEIIGGQYGLVFGDGEDVFDGIILNADSCNFDGQSQCAVRGGDTVIVTNSYFTNCNFVYFFYPLPDFNPDFIRFNNCKMSNNNSCLNINGDITGLYIDSGLIVNNNRGIIFQSGGVSNLKISNSTIAFNQYQSLDFTYSDIPEQWIDISNNIIAFNGEGVVAIDDLSGSFLSCNDVYGNGVCDYCFGDQTGLNGNISVDPMFCFPDTGNYYLDESSACLPANNLCNELMGYYSDACGPSLDCGDCNGDGSVNILDITLLISYLYQGGEPPYNAIIADVNSDGLTNILDITALISFLYFGGEELICTGI